MSVWLLSKDNTTDFCRFTFDVWETDKECLPTLNSAGKGVLSTIKSTSMGSLAIGTNGDDYILSGNNQWVKYNGSFGGGSGSGGSSDSGGSGGSNDGFIEL